jgi:hypothetical protein
VASRDSTEIDNDYPGIILHLSTDAEIHQCLALPSVPAGLVQGVTPNDSRNNFLAFVEQQVLFICGRGSDVLFHVDGVKVEGYFHQ